MIVAHVGQLAITVSPLGIILILCLAFGGGVSVTTRIIRRDLEL